MAGHLAEQWRPIPGYEDYYEVSDLGRVRSLERVVRNGKGYRKLPERILSPVPVRTRRDGVSRYIVNLHKDGVMRWSRLPHVVLNAFVGPRPEGQECRHRNCDTSDNRLTNLRWGTKEQNNADSTRLQHFHRGEQHGEAKLTTAQVIEIRKLRAEGVSGTAIAAQFGVSHTLIYLIAKKKAWAHVSA